MADEVPAGPQPEPSPAPQARGRAPRRVRYQKRPEPGVGNVIATALCITTAAGIVFAIAIPGMLSSQGARYSVRIEWQRRDAELDAAAEQARREGKIPPAPETTPRE